MRINTSTRHAARHHLAVLPPGHAVGVGQRYRAVECIGQEVSSTGNVITSKPFVHAKARQDGVDRTALLLLHRIGTVV